MLCQLADFQFESAGVNIESTSDSYQYSFDQTQTINDWDDFQSTGRHQHSRTISGLLIQKSAHSLDKLLDIAAKKQPVTLALESGLASRVLIKSIDTNQSYFLSNGMHLKRDFTISLEFLNG